MGRLVPRKIDSPRLALIEFFFYSCRSKVGDFYEIPKKSRKFVEVWKMVQESEKVGYNLQKK